MQKLLGANEAFEIYYDSDWQPGGRRVYCAAVDLSIKDDLLTAVIQFSRVKDGQLIYRLETKEFLGVTVQ